MMRHRIGKYLIGLAVLCSVLLGEAAQAKAKKPTSPDLTPPPCSMDDKQSREKPGNCAAPDPYRAPPPQQSPPPDTADKNRSLANDRKQAPQDGEHNGHFDAKGRTGLIPVGRVGWREIGTWREMHRVRGIRQEP
jgi:hypothetical protein